MLRNVPGQFHYVVCFDANGRVSGEAANLSCTLAIDNGVRSPLATDVATEIGTTGIYRFALSAAETNGHEQSFITSCATLDVQVLGMPSNIIYTVLVDTLNYGDWTISRLFTADGESLANVQMSLVGVAGKVTRSGDDGVATLKAANGTYTLRFSVPVFFEPIPDVEVVISDADSVAVDPIIVTRPVLPVLPNDLLSNCTVTAINQHGDPAVYASVIASSKNPGADDEQIFVFNEDREYLTNASGQTSLPLLRGHRYAITVTFGDFGSRTVLRTIPDEDTFHILVKL